MNLDAKHCSGGLLNGLKSHGGEGVYGGGHQTDFAPNFVSRTGIDRLWGAYKPVKTYLRELHSV